MPTVQQLHALLQKEPDDLFLNFGLAMELARIGQTDESIAQFDRVIAMSPQYIPAFFQKGRALMNAGRIDEAKSALIAGIETAKSTGELHAAEEMTALLETM